MGFTKPVQYDLANSVAHIDTSKTGTPGVIHPVQDHHLPSLSDIDEQISRYDDEITERRDVVGVLKQEVLAVRSKLKAANAVMKKLGGVFDPQRIESDRARSYERRIRPGGIPAPCGWDLSKCKGSESNAEANALAIKITKLETALSEFERRIPANEKRIEFVAANRKEYVAMWSERRKELKERERIADQVSGF